MSEIRKCVIWDLDNTLWDGVCIEGEVRVRPGVRHAIEELDRRGILHSIASRSVQEVALAVLKQCNLDGFFVIPKINWLPKPTNIITISKDLGVSLDAIAFIDDDRFEREQVSFMLPDVMTIEAQRAEELPLMPPFIPSEITTEAGYRRQLYKDEQKRKNAESTFPNRESFLNSCHIRLGLRSLTEKDIPRVLELMSRTHQLNTTGQVLSREELLKVFHGESGQTAAVVADLMDRFGNYGTIGVALAERGPTSWTLRYLAVSCRVLGRGIERAFLASLLSWARKLGFKQVRAVFRDTGKNREMRVLYQMMGFRRCGFFQEDGTMEFHARTDEAIAGPPWVEVTCGFF